MIAAVVLAAGRGSRYDGVKQLHPIAGRAMLERVVATVASAGLDDLVVVLGARADQVREAVELGDSRVVVCPHWGDGQAASLRCGLDSLAPEIDAAMVVLGDGPGLMPAAIERLRERHLERPQSVLAADYGEGRSHPVVLPRTAWRLLPRDGETPGRGLDWEPVDCSDLDPPGDIDYSS